MRGRAARPAKGDRERSGKRAPAPETRTAEVRAFVRDRDAAAKALDPVCFEREYIARDRPDDFRRHMFARRDTARRKATIVMHALTDRGWRPPESTEA